MSKYIVDIDDFEPHFKVDSIGVFGIGKSLSYSEEDHSWSRIKSIEEFEELNSDYIKEHFGELQDEAYKRGYEDGKKSQNDDRIEVGDIVERYIDGKLDSKGVYLQEDGGYWRCLFYTGAIFMTFAYPKGQFKKTGKHYDIQSILEAMRT